MVIRNIVYLDVDKLHSMSSQVFEGVTEYILNERDHSSENSEAQKGPVGSGRVLGDILKQREMVSEKRFLVDHSFSLFEKKLLEEARVLNLNPFPSEREPLQIRPNTFVRVRSKVIFNDMSSVKSTVEKFNEVGSALASVTTHGQLTQAKLLLSEAKSTGDSSAVIKGLEANVKALSNADELAKKTGLYQDPKFLKDLVTMLNFGYQDQFEVQMKVGEQIFSANLKRECLREREDLLIRKYSRYTEVEFVLFGVVTQVEHSARSEVVEIAEGAKLKEAVAAMIGLLSNLEGTFTGRLKNEVIIDPVALYTEIS